MKGDKYLGFIHFKGTSPAKNVRKMLFSIYWFNLIVKKVNYVFDPK